MLLSDGVVRLVPLDASFVDYLTAIRTDWRNYDYFFDFHLATRQQQLDWIARVSQDASQANFVIVPVDAPTQPLGTVSLTSIDRRSHHAEYGRAFVDPGQRRRGIARRASELIVGYAFCELNLRRLYLRVFADNEPAIRLYRRLGFEEEGRLRQHVFKNGRYRDVTIMARFADGWPCRD
jgi:diamine N-acetyltransferase